MVLRVGLCYPGADPAPWLEGLRARLPGAEVSAWSPGAGPVDYGVVWTPPQQFIDEQPRLKALFNLGAGVDRLLQLTLPPHLRIVRLDDAGMAVQMAEYVCHALVRHYRGFDTYAAQASRGIWQQHAPRPRSEFPVGILGLGVLGERVARAVLQFDFPVLGWSRSPRSLAGVHCFNGMESLEGFLASTRVLVCLLPLTAATRGLLDRHRLASLRPGGYVINVARGALLDDTALLDLIDQGHLSGATLDVFPAEPLPVEHPAWRHPRITITPHISAQTLEIESLAQIAGKILALERGDAVAGIVDRTQGY